MACLQPKFALRTLLLLGSLLLSLPLLAATQSWQLHNRPASDVASQLRQLYPTEQAAITAQGQQLFVRGEAAILEEIDQLIETMDVAPVQFRVTVRSLGQDNGVRQGAGVSITNNNVNVGGEHRVTSTQRVREQSLIILDGQSAHIHSGQIRVVPVAVQGGFNPAALYQQVRIRSGFIVNPRLISERQVELNVMAFDNMPDEDQPGFETQAVMTSRRITPGSWVELGSTSQTHQGSETGLVYEVGQHRLENQRYEVQVDIL
ncbi:secretin N-terminal domain-containing protein [Marinobacter zhejiangensis]|uniref:NolW-like domain-containing protein n=1 Tax=Marinobacter zhejiangensis TaxID=488535 RepID=A0A1I4L080_9GAMM|nr:secretin N-terminal domain-containing protein [Marinobacter zhejiangensis]SFL84404.1 hypothetical protein SAMN04487963_0189 [Marinobacter zhejiangensis]